jgi:hypothetical protein
MEEQARKNAIETELAKHKNPYWGIVINGAADLPAPPAQPLGTKG